MVLKLCLAGAFRGRSLWCLPYSALGSFFKLLVDQCLSLQKCYWVVKMAHKCNSGLFFRILSPHAFGRPAGDPGFAILVQNRRPMGQKLGATLDPKWVPFLAQNGGHFWSKMGVTFGPKWVQLLVQIGGNFGSRMEATLDPKWAPLWPQNGSHHIFLNIVKCAR